MTIAERLRQLIDENNMKPAEATKKLEISGSSFTDWKNGKASPSLDILIKFSKYFDVSLDYLVFGVETVNFNRIALELSNERESNLINNFRLLPIELQDKILTYTEGMIAALPYNGDFQEEKSRA